jgi:hypothetical protein
MQEQASLKLITSIDENKNSVRTKSLDLSFNELLDMYKSSELKINPDYQRLFRWSSGKESRFVESLILEMPIPPIFVIEEENSKYELIDGLQRISSYLHFRGELNAPHRDIKKGEKLILSECDIITSLNGLTVDELPEAMVIRLKRMFIRVEVIRRESDRRLRYHMFKRLNTGGETLSDQEIRNCTIRLLDERFNAFIIELSQTSDFLKCVENISDTQRAQMYPEELVLRFFAFKNNISAYQHDVGDFMTEYLESVSEGALDFDYVDERAVFLKTFEVLAKTLGEYSFGWTNKSDAIVSRFSVYHYEAFTLGLQTVIEKLDASDAGQMTRLDTILRKIKKDTTLADVASGGGKNTRPALNRRIEAVQHQLIEFQ